MADGMADGPAARIVAAAQATQDVTDAAGRVPTVRRPGALDRLRLFKAAGAVLAGNPAWLGLATIAASVVALDGVPLPFPTTEGQVEAVVQRLGDHGIAAVSVVLAAMRTLPDPAADLAKN